MVKGATVLGGVERLLCCLWVGKEVELCKEVRRYGCTLRVLVQREGD